jgi:hypothetical protein
MYNNNGVRRKDKSGSDEEVDSEDERDRRLALGSRLDQDQGVVVKQESVATKDTVKRPRSAKPQVIDDDDKLNDDGNPDVDKNGPAAGRDA